MPHHVPVPQLWISESLKPMALISHWIHTEHQLIHKTVQGTSTKINMRRLGFELHVNTIRTPSPDPRSAKDALGWVWGFFTTTIRRSNGSAAVSSPIAVAALSPRRMRFDWLSQKALKPSLLVKAYFPASSGRIHYQVLAEEHRSHS